MNSFWSGKIAVDETVAPVLDPGRGRANKGYFWAIVRVIAALYALESANSSHAPRVSPYRRAYPDTGEDKFLVIP